MGPRSFDRGEQSATAVADATEHRFNGAAVRRPRRATAIGRTSRRARRLQWGRGPETAESCAVDASCRVHRRSASMGPRSGDRGERARAADARAAQRRLQWGRGPETAESSAMRRSAGRPRTCASMGPRSGDRGEHDQPQRSASRFTTCFNGAAVRRPRRVRRAMRLASARSSTSLQWGRGPETAESVGRGCCRAVDADTLQWGRGPETAESRVAARLHAAASARLQWGRGPETAESADRALGAVAAVDALQWGRGPETAERRDGVAKRRSDRRASMGPRSGDRGELISAGCAMPRRSWLQWGRGPETAESAMRAPMRCARHRGFNGAAVRRPRRVAQSSHERLQRSTASMGPRSGDRGEREPTCSRASAISGFNGAAVRRPRRGSADVPASAIVERRFNGAAVRRPRRARRAAGVSSARADALQWGRGPETAERRSIASPSDSRRRALQWGRGPATAESQLVSCSSIAGIAASMGPRSGDRGEATCIDRRGRREARFNGAAVRRPRRAAARTSRVAADDRLQWGRGPETAESDDRCRKPCDRRCASMGPRSGDRGERRRGSQTRR